MNIVGLSGSISAPSRTRSLVESIVQAIGRRTLKQGDVIDVAEIAVELGQALSFADYPVALNEAIDELTSADIIVVGVPIYKASYPGLFKHFFDLIDPKALEGKVAVIAATGGSNQHALVLEHQLRTLLSFMGVYSAPKTVFALDSDFTNYRLVNPDIVKRIDALAEQALWLARKHCLDLGAERQAVHFSVAEERVSSVA